MNRKERWTIRFPHNTKDIALPLMLIILSLVFFKDIVLGGHLLFGSDFVAFYLGMKQFLYDEIHLHRSIPFWNPYIFGGIPFWAHFESTIFYPLDFLFWILSPERAFGYTVFLHVVLICLSMYFLARTLAISPSGSFVAAVVYGFNGLVMATLYDGQMYRVQAFLWIPLIICLLYLSMVRKRWILYAMWSGVTWGIQILAGAPQDAFYTFIAALLFLACHMSAVGQGFRSHLRVFTISCILFLGGLGIAAVQVVPAFEFIGESVRGAFDRYEFLTEGSYPLQGFVTFFLPHFFGNYTRSDFWVSGVPWSIPLYNLYAGVLPVFLLFFLTFHDSKKARLLVFTVVLAILSLLLAFGSNTPAYKLVALIPGFDKIRAPAKIIVLWVFAMALLAGRGFDDLLAINPLSLRRRTVIISCLASLLLLLVICFHLNKGLLMKFFSGFILPDAIPERLNEAETIIRSEFNRLMLFAAIIALTLAFWYKRKIRTSFVVMLFHGLIVFDLAYANWGAVRHNDGIYRWARTTKQELDRTIGKDPETYRVGSFEFGMSPNIEMYLRYQTVGGYTPFFLQRYYEYINSYTENSLPEAWVSFFYGRNEKTKFMDLLNVKYEIDYAGRTISLRDSYLPRAFLVPACQIMEKQEVLKRLANPDFDPTKTVLFEKGVGPHLARLNSTVSVETSLKPDIRIQSFRPDSILLEADSSWPGYLFLSEVFYPGWKAFIDGQPTPLLRGNHLFRVIQLPAGHHRVWLRFDPLTIKLGVGVSVLTLSVILGALVPFFLRRRVPVKQLWI